MLTVALILLAYVIGAIPFSFLVARVLGGVDLRTIGSGNVGATNTLRNLGRKAGAIAFGLDALKGTLAAVLGSVLGNDLTAGLLCGVFAVVGHCWSIFLKFSGGKGVATSAGVAMVFVPLPFLLALTVFLFAVVLTRLVSLGSILSAIMLPFATLFWAERPEYIGFSIALSVIVLYKHNVNFQRLLQGKEEKLGSKKNSD